MKMYGEVDVYVLVFLTLALNGGKWSASRPGRFTSGEIIPGTLWIGGWVGPRAGLDDVEKRKILPLPGLELTPLCRPARGKSIYCDLSWFFSVPPDKCRDYTSIRLWLLLGNDCEISNYTTAIAK
jgi:hypothetical protein